LFDLLFGNWYLEIVWKLKIGNLIIKLMFPKDWSPFIPFFITIYLLLLLVFVALLIILSLAKRLEKERKINAIAQFDLKKFKLAVANASDQIIIADRGGVIIYANKALEATTGYAVEEAIGTKTGKLWGGLMPAEYYKKLWKTIAKDKKTFSSEIKNRRKNGQEYFAKINIDPILDEDRRVQFFVAVERDITREKELDQAKSDFISIASHQLRTPLTVIKGYVSMILEGSFGQVASQQKEQLTKVYEANERLINLVQDLLDVSRIESGKMQFVFTPNDLNTLVASVVEELKTTADSKKLYLKFQTLKTLPKIKIDPEKLRQVIMNLIDNAIKYTVAGGVEISLVKRENKVRFIVADTGMGIKGEDMPQLFKKYSRGSKINDKSVSGTGLGLYVGKIIVEAHGGKIWAESEGEGKGSKFCFELPISK